MDVGLLLTSRDLDGSTVGLGYVSGMCHGGFSAAIASVGSGELGYAAAVVAHELGHNFGMEHDAVGDDGAPAYLMSASTPQASSMQARRWGNMANASATALTASRRPPPASESARRSARAEFRARPGRLSLIHI